MGLADKVVKTIAINMFRNLRKNMNIMRREIKGTKENEMKLQKLKNIM